MEKDDAPIDPFAPGRKRRRLAVGVWIGIGLLVYAGFVATCFRMESVAHAKFKVPSTADIQAITDRTKRIRAEAARTNALADMRSWRPYEIYDTSLSAILIGGTALAMIVGSIVIWRGVRRDSIFSVKRIVLGVLLVGVASLLLLGWPAIVADKRFEATRTSASDGT